MKRRAFIKAAVMAAGGTAAAGALAGKTLDVPLSATQIPPVTIGPYRYIAGYDIARDEFLHQITQLVATNGKARYYYIETAPTNEPPDKFVERALAKLEELRR